VIGVGDADVDIFLAVDHVPGQDEKVLAVREEHHPGGMVGNFLCALGRLGTSCGFHGPVGDDEFGRMALEDFAANGVDTSGAVVKPGGRTYYCIVMLDESGEKALVVVPTDCSHLQPEEVSEAQIARARHLHTTGARPTTLKAVGLAKGYGLTVSVDLESLARVGHDALLLLLPQADVLFINRRGAESLAEGSSIERAAEWAIAHGSQVVCVTMGEAGSLVVSKTTSFRAQAFSVPVADTTGAGDCYAAGFVHGFLKGWPLEQTATFASAVGALAVARWGGHASAPTFEEARTFLAAREVILYE